MYFRRDPARLSHPLVCFVEPLIFLGENHGPVTRIYSMPYRGQKDQADPATTPVPEAALRTCRNMTTPYEWCTAPVASVHPFWDPTPGFHAMDTIFLH